MKTGGALRLRDAGAALLAMLGAGPAMADCSSDAAFDVLKLVQYIDWPSPQSEEFDTTEGPGYRDSYETGWRATRIDEDFCASYYCANTVELKTPDNHRIVVFYTWGGASLPDTDAETVVLGDYLTEESCVVSHRGDDQFRNGGPDLVRQMMGLGTP